MTLRVWHCEQAVATRSRPRQKRDWDTIVANMYERWGMSAPDEVQAISAYLVAQFGRN